MAQVKCEVPKAGDRWLNKDGTPVGPYPNPRLFLDDNIADGRRIILQGNVNTIARTPNPKCPACQEFRCHRKTEWRKWHPLAGHGFTSMQGWTHPALKSEAGEQKT